MDDQSLPISTKAIYSKSESMTISNDYSSSPITDSESSSDTDNETVTLTNVNPFVNNINKNVSKYKIRSTGKRIFNGKSKSVTVSRSSSNTGMISEKIYINHISSDDNQSSTSETDDLSSDDNGKLIYKRCLENVSSTKGIYLKKSISKPECALKHFRSNSSESKEESNRRFVKNNRLRSSKSISHCKNNEFQSDNQDEGNLFYRQLDGNMKSGKLSRFKVIKSRSNSTFQFVRNNSNNKNYDSICAHQNKIKEAEEIKKEDQISNQLQLDELAKRLRFIEQKLFENEFNTEKKFKSVSQNINSSTYRSHHQLSQLNAHQSKNENPLNDPQNKNDIRNDRFHICIHPSISFGDCSEINSRPKNENKRHFLSSAKSALKNSKSIPSYKSTKSSVEKLPGSHSLKSSSSKIWKAPFNMLSNLVDDKLRGRWHSRKSSSKRSNSICLTSDVEDNQLDKSKKSDKPLYGPIFNIKKDIQLKNADNKFINNFSNIMVTGENNSKFSPSKNSSNINQLIEEPQKIRANIAMNDKLQKTTNDKIFNLLSLPFMDEKDYRKSHELDAFDHKIKQSKSYKEIGSQALKEIEAFEKLLSDSFINNKLKTDPSN